MKTQTICAAFFIAALTTFSASLGTTGAAEQTSPATGPKQIQASVVRKPLSLDSIRGVWPVQPTQGPRKYESGYETLGATFRCEVAEFDKPGAGVSYWYDLKQKQAKPIIIVGKSKAENVSGNRDAGYSLYVDLIYDDDTPLWGQIHPFPIGDSDWSEGKIVIFPDRPVKSLTVYGMFRGHTGVVYFKDFALYECDSNEDAAFFDFAPVTEIERSPDAPQLFVRYPLRANNTSNFIGAPDADENAVYQIGRFEVRKSTNRLPAGVDETVLNLRLQPVHVSIDYHNADGERTNFEELEEFYDCVFTFYYALPIPEPRPGARWVWFDDPRGYRELSSDERRTTRKLPDVGAGETSKYPFGVVAERIETEDGVRWGAAFGIALDPDYPAFYRIAANGATRELYVAYDLALTKEKPEIELRLLPLCWRLSDGGDLVPTSLADYRADSTPNTPFGSTPFRAAFDAWRRAFPEAVKVRAQRQGNWMAFAKISKVRDWQDFGFVFKEGVDETAEDDARGMTSFRYTEPMTWWFQIQKSETSPKSREKALDAAKEIALKNERRADGSPAWLTDEARSLFTTGMRDVDGAFTGKLLDTPWCDGIVWSMNDAPGLVELARSGKLSTPENEGIEPIASFETKWNDEIANRQFGEPLAEDKLPKTREEFLDFEARPGIDGEYVDSSEGYVTAELDFTREYFSGMTTPLTFDAETRRPAIFRGLVAYEYVRKISEDVHARGRLIMANATPSLHFWLAPRLDVLGTETNWNWGGGWRPMTDDELMFRRVLSAGKPYCFLMNTDFSQFTKECSERYMKRALAYGMFPSYFSADASTRHYFENPELYERDRPLFKRYMPIVTRVAEAGWEPEPCAETNDAKLYVERFGALPGASVASNPLRDGDAIYLTLFNDSDETKDYAITLAPELVAALQKSGAEIYEELTEQRFDGAASNWILKGKIDAQDVRVFRLDAAK